jgi:hypothetical protein
MTNWGDDELTQFLEQVHHNQQGNRERLAEPYRLIQRVNDCFVVAGKYLVDPKPPLAGLLFLRSQYAYKAAAAMALAGQVVEAFAMMRLCLEYAGYALTVYGKPQDDTAPTPQQIFLNRHVDEDSMKAQKEEFKIVNIRSTIEKFDPALSRIFKTLYDRTIDFGAHPNPYAALTMMKIEEPQPNVSGGFVVLALTTEDLPLRHCMQNSAQVGLTALFIFQHIFRAKFELLGIRTEMDALRRDQL